MSFDSGVLVSLPANDLKNAQLSECLFSLDVCRTANLSSPLRSALNLFEECLEKNTPKLFLARPEMFTEGATLQWLNNHTHGVKDHMCFSDGATIRLIPGFRNHVFFVGLGAAKHVDALIRLERRVPEIFTQIHSQFNSALKFRWRKSDVIPKTYAAMPGLEADRKVGEFRRLVINRHSLQDSVIRMAESLPLEVQFSQFRTLNYIRVTETGFYDELIAKSMLSLVAESLVDRTQGIVFVLPDATKTDSALEARLLVLAEGLFAGGGRLPNVVSPNVFVATQDLSAQALKDMPCVKRLVVDDFADFWRSPAIFYENFENITVYARRQRHIPEQLEDLMRVAYGPPATIKWLESPSDVYPHSGY